MRLEVLVYAPDWTTEAEQLELYEAVSKGLQKILDRRGGELHFGVTTPVHPRPGVIRWTRSHAGPREPKS